MKFPRLTWKELASKISEMDETNLEQDVMIYLAYEKVPCIFNKKGLWADVPEASETITLVFDASSEKTVDVFINFLEEICGFKATKEIKK